MNGARNPFFGVSESHQQVVRPITTDEMYFMRVILFISKSL